MAVLAHIILSIPKKKKNKLYYDTRLHIPFSFIAFVSRPFSMSHCSWVSQQKEQILALRCSSSSWPETPRESGGNGPDPSSMLVQPQGFGSSGLHSGSAHLAKKY